MDGNCDEDEQELESDDRDVEVEDSRLSRGLSGATLWVVGGEPLGSDCSDTGVGDDDDGSDDVEGERNDGAGGGPRLITVELESFLESGGSGHLGGGGVVEKRRRW